MEPAYETDSLKHRRKESYVRFLLHSMESAIQNQNLTYTTGYKCNFTKKKEHYFFTHTRFRIFSSLASANATLLSLSDETNWEQRANNAAGSRKEVLWMFEIRGLESSSFLSIAESRSQTY